MRCIIQRVLNASVTVGGNKISKINKGLLVLVGVHRDDTKADREWLARKILNLRLWPDEQGKPWNKSVKDMGYEVLLVSQFTLYTTLKGPSLCHKQKLKMFVSDICNMLVRQQTRLSFGDGSS